MGLRANIRLAAAEAAIIQGSIDQLSPPLRRKLEDLVGVIAEKTDDHIVGQRQQPDFIFDGPDATRYCVTWHGKLVAAFFEIKGTNGTGHYWMNDRIWLETATLSGLNGITVLISDIRVQD